MIVETGIFKLIENAINIIHKKVTVNIFNTHLWLKHKFIY